MDLEDAHKLKILSTDEVTALMLGFFDPSAADAWPESWP